MAHNGDAPKQQQELVEKLDVALTALRQTNDQMQCYEQTDVAPNPQ